MFDLKNSIVQNQILSQGRGITYIPILIRALYSSNMLMLIVIFEYLGYDGGFKLQS